MPKMENHPFWEPYGCEIRASHAAVARIGKSTGLAGGRGPSSHRRRAPEGDPEKPGVRPPIHLGVPSISILSRHPGILKPTGFWGNSDLLWKRRMVGKNAGVPSPE